MPVAVHQCMAHSRGMWKCCFALLLVVVTGCRAIEPIDSAPALSSLPSSERERVTLGQRLFYETRLSQDGQTACASCHTTAHAGADEHARSLGVQQQPTARNAPTVYNTSVHEAWFWDGRANSLEDQVRGPLLSKVEMGGDEAAIVALLRADASYQQAFERAFGTASDPITIDNLTRAVAAYERQLLAPSRVDRELRGEHVLGASEERGMRAFQACTRCHDGPGVGGARLAKLGAEEPWPEARSSDLGRETVTGDPDDRLVFAVPSLRNVGRTAPYFHDGSVETLEEAVRLMGWHQLGQRLSPSDVADLVAFLRAFDASPRADLIQAP